ncbi:MAG: YggS family pyridoxal phosphate-dependent enzyme [Crocinitomicaceae bacterium]
MIKRAIANILTTIPATVKLVAVSKTKPNNLLQEAYDAGQRVFGENKAQEMAGKAIALPNDIQWHFIGHLQSNKVKYIASSVSVIHSVDSFKILKKIDKEAKKNERVIQVLLQFHIAKEVSKFGFNLETAKEMLELDEFQLLENIEIIGVMGMATFTDDHAIVRNEFKKLKSIFTQLKQTHFSDKNHFSEVSMGMSGDYQIAIEEGSTMIRVGSSIFGSRG